MGSAAPVDTTDDPELEARWQALVHELIDAKDAAAAARAACIAAEKARGPLDTASEEAIADVARCHAVYRAAGGRVLAAATLMKEGRL